MLKEMCKANVVRFPTDILYIPTRDLIFLFLRAHVRSCYEVTEPMLVMNHETYDLEEHFIKWPVSAAPQPLRENSFEGAFR